MLRRKGEKRKKVSKELELRKETKKSREKRKPKANEEEYNRRGDEGARK